MVVPKQFMMKKIIYISGIIFYLGLNVALAQYNATVKLDNGCKLFKGVSVGNALILFTGSENIIPKNLNWKISYYTPHVKAKYDILVPNPDVKSLAGSFLVVSPSGNNVYLIRHGEGGLSGSENNQNIMFIDSAGFSWSTMMKGELEYSRVNVVFADDEFLYYVTKEKDPNALSKHDFPKLQFVRIAKDKSVSKIMLALPEPDPDATEWSYFGHTGVVSYFVSRSLNDENYTEQKFRVAVIDHNGHLQDDFKIDFDLKSGKLLPEYNYCGTEGTYEVNNHNIRPPVGKGNGEAGKSSSLYSPFPEAYGNIMLDPQTNGFYIYGISGNPAAQKKDKSAKKEEAPDPSGYYVYKYDPDGKEVWNNETKFTGFDDYFKTKAGFSARQVALSYGAQGNLRFQAFSEKTVATSEINPQTGKFISAFSNTFENTIKRDDLGNAFKKGEKTSLGQFLSKPDKGGYSQLNFRMLNANIVVRDFNKDARLELNGFVDE